MSDGAGLWVKGFLTSQTTNRLNVNNSHVALSLSLYPYNTD